MGAVRVWDETKFSRFLNRRSTLEGNRAGYSSNLFTYYSPYSRNNRSIGTIFLSKILAALELRPFLSPTLLAELFSLFFFQCQSNRSPCSLGFSFPRLLAPIYTTNGRRICLRNGRTILTSKYRFERSRAEILFVQISVSHPVHFSRSRWDTSFRERIAWSPILLL